MSKARIGFIGLGLMGGAMVGRLQDLGYALTVLGNKDRSQLDIAISRGAQEASTAKAVAEASDIVMLCMGTSEHVEGRMRGTDGVIAGLRPGTVVVDFGTSLPGSSRALALEVAAAGGQLLDAPLGRTPSHAKDGLLNIMASGDKTAFDAVEPVLQDQGENVFYLGAVGSGHTIKLINNFFGMTIANAMAEAFAMADVAGVDRSQLYDVMAAGPLHSGMMGFVKAYGVDGDPSQLAFAIKNAAKDVGYYARMAEEAGVDSLMSKGPLAALNEARDTGQADDMVSQMVDFYVQAVSIVTMAVLAKSMADLPRLGIVLMLAAWLLFSWVDTGAKWLAMAGFSAFQLAFMRYAGHLVISIGVIAKDGFIRERFQTGHVWQVISRALLLVSATLSNFYASAVFAADCGFGHHVFQPGGGVFPFGLCSARKGRALALGRDFLGIYRRIDRRAPLWDGLSPGHADDHV